MTDLVIFLCFGMVVAGVLAVTIELLGSRLSKNLFHKEMEAWRKLKKDK